MNIKAYITFLINGMSACCGFTLPSIYIHIYTCINGCINDIFDVFITIAHPKKPSEARVEDLKEPFEHFDVDAESHM